MNSTDPQTLARSGAHAPEQFGDLEQLETVARMAAAVGADAIRRTAPDRLNVRVKTDPTDLVTTADENAESAVISMIRRHRPWDEITSEERGLVTGARNIRWSVDPLDGTANFTAGNPDYAVSVGCFVGELPAFGAIHRPADDIAVSTRTVRPDQLRWPRPSSAIRLAVGVPYGVATHAEAWDIIHRLTPYRAVLDRTGSAACDLLKLVTGGLDVYISVGLYEWDTAAGRALVRSAGGTSVQLQSVGGQEVWVCGSSANVAEFRAHLLQASLCNDAAPGQPSTRTGPPVTIS
ncbi:inositol monophosphatase [Streptomyces sp. NBC_01288]|uniref:inositol monophosphatase family protein n=1 Tax=Streptomyces sp. NBC_01288 TaxID=2903814 RepID=UPI002E14B9BD|nr:inositol monophosphatase [Streptomyces sp. NBC_01288]